MKLSIVTLFNLITKMSVVLFGKLGIVMGSIAVAKDKIITNAALVRIEGIALTLKAQHLD
ncbi:hypothetical protein [Mycoplasmoides pneumoniae]|nr:hypothetical protein [Mycoplasmoides pneumoniae]